MLFSWTVNGCKLIAVFILPSNSHFPENRERVEGEGDAPARRERERERMIGSPFNFDFAVRLWIRSTSPSHRSRLQSQHRFVVPDREPRFVTPQNRLSSTPKPIVLPLFLLLSIWSDYDFFFLGFICVSVWFWFLLLWWCDCGVLVVVAFDRRSLLLWVELPCEKFLGK